ncbi:hypothetical protein N7516_010749, partial [Penicillium verrucosum]|uniref:uncharacterized protein n=1 Tax=Penicillium verrucosum TaxID=60171 RepID=UPI00254548EB
PGRGFLGDLAPSSPSLPISGPGAVAQYHQAVATASKDTTTTSEWYLIERVNNSIFTTCFPAKEGPFASWSSCDAQSDRVLLRMTKSKPHEVASEIFEVLLHDATKPIGMDRTLRLTGIQISRKGSKIITMGSPLVIEFEKLFLRPPWNRMEPRERDIQIDDGDLQFLAEQVWDCQGRGCENGD